MPIGFIAQLQGDAEVAAKMNSLGGAFGNFDQRVQAVNTSTGQTLPKSLDATASAAGRAGTAVESSGKSMATAALGLSSAASGAFALYNQYDRLEKIQVRIQQTQKAVTAAQRAGLDSQRALTDLEAKGITTGSQYESAVLRVSQAKQQAEIATDRLAIAENDLNQGYVQFGLTILPTVFSAVQGVSSALTILKTAHIGVSIAGAATSATMVAGSGAMATFTFSTHAATFGTKMLALGMKLLHIAMGPVGWIILAVGTALTLFATNAFGFRDAVNAAGKAIGEFFPMMKPVLDALSALANLAFPETADAATTMADETEMAMTQISTSTTTASNKVSDALDKIKDKFKELGKSTEATKTKPLAATEEDDPFLDKLITGLSGKRQKLTDEKLRIIQEIGFLTTGVRTKLEDLPTEVPEIEKLADKIREELSANLKVDFDFDATGKDLEKEFEELMDGLTRKREPLSIMMQIEHDTLQKDLDDINDKIEKKEQSIRARAGGRGLEELREQLSAGTLTEKDDEFIVYMLEQLDELGEKAVTVKEQLRDITHVDFEPFAATTSGQSRGEVLAQKEVNREVEAVIRERIRIIETLESLTFGSKMTLNDAAKKDIAGLSELAEGQAAKLKDIFDIDFDFNADDIDAEIQKVHNAMFEAFQKAQADATTSASEIQASVDDSLEGLSGSAATASSALTESMDGIATSFAASTTSVNNSLFEMQGGFFSMANNVLNRMADFKKEIHEAMISVVSDIGRVEKSLDIGGATESKGTAEKTTRTTGRGSRPDQNVNVKLTMSDDLKYLIRKASVENISDGN